MTAFEPAINDYLEDLKVARRCSPHTVSNYARDLKAVAKSAAERQIENWKDLTGSDVRAIIAEQHVKVLQVEVLRVDYRHCVDCTIF